LITLTQEKQLLEIKNFILYELNKN
jgi:hypothetical protein